MTDNLKRTAARGLFWSFFERIGQQGIQFVISIILARLLMPEHFGLIAMLLIFMAIAQAFIDGGFGAALIQKQEINHLDECSIFYFNILVGILTAGLLSLSASLIAAFYKTPILVSLIQVLSLNMIINSFSIVQTALLTKRIDFKAQMRVSWIATIISGSIGVIMAYNAFGVWSLVAQSITANLLRTALLWIFVRWRPSWMFSFNSLRSMSAFGSKLLCSGLLETFYNNLYLMIIGKLFSATDLGFYSRANQMQQFAVGNISDSVSRVTYPVFSSIQDDKQRLKRGVRKALATMVMVIFPLMTGIAIVAEPLVLVLLSEKWLPCVPYLQLLCVVGIFYPLHVINLNVLSAQGRSDLFFRLEILKKCLGIILIVGTYRWGIAMMIVGQIVGSVICYFLNSYYTGKFLGYPILEQARDLLPSLSLSLVMGCAVYMINFMSFARQPVMLLVQITTGLALYPALCWLTKLSSFMEALDVIKPKLLKYCRGN